MNETFDPRRYRQDLLGKIQERKVRGNEVIAKARESGRDWDVERAFFERSEMMHEPLRLARWSEDYHRAKLLTHGNYTVGERGQIIENQSGFTTQELADIAKFEDYLRYNNVKEVLAVLAEAEVPARVLSNAKNKEASKQLLWNEAHYGWHEGESGIGVVNAPEIHAFVRLFSLEETLRHIISSTIDDLLARSLVQKAKELLAAYPLFDANEIDARLESRYPSADSGLRGSVEAHELFGDALDGDTESIVFGEVMETFSQHAELLAHDLKNTPEFYWALKSRLSRDGNVNNASYGRWMIIRDSRRGASPDGKQYCRVLYFLSGTEKDSRVYQRNDEMRDGLRLEFQFSCSDDDAEKDQQEGSRFYTTANIFHFEGLYIGNGKWGGFGPGGEFGRLVRADQESLRSSAFASWPVRKGVLKTFLEKLLAPEKDFTQSLSSLDVLGKKYNLPPGEVRRLSRAIVEFGTYMYSKKRSDIGDCLSTPNDFSSFCRRKFGLEFHGARYGEYHPEWGNDMGYAPFTFYHEVSVYQKSIVIDWTATQFGHSADKPMPYIYEIGEERKSLGPLYRSSSSFADPNIPFIQDVRDPLYRHESPIAYGI